MAISRYKRINIINNNDQGYRKQFASSFKERTAIQHLETSSLVYPSMDDIKGFGYINHIWTMGDKYYKLAHQYYGEPEYWWVIAWFNKKPTEHHIALGDLIKIPTPLNDVLDSMGI